jgi:hypothetical protein
MRRSATPAIAFKNSPPTLAPAWEELLSPEEDGYIDLNLMREGGRRMVFA